MPEINYKNLTNKADDREILSSADEKIRALLGNLKRVEAPNDFDFRVRASIARRSRADYRPRFLPVLRYVLPLGLVLLLSAAFVFNSLYFPDQINVSRIAENASPLEIKKEAETFPAKRGEAATAAIFENETARDGKTVAAASINSNAAKERNQKIGVPPVVAVKSIENTKAAPKKTVPEMPGGTRLSASTAPPRIITPPGINPNRTIQSSPNPANTQSLTAKEVLSQLGIESVFENDGWKVLAVRPNSPAQRSGVETGDAVQSIDDEKLTDKPLRNKIIEGKNLTVKRGSRRIEISLNN